MAYYSVAVFCEQGNEHMGFIKDGKLHDRMSRYQLLMKESNTGTCCEKNNTTSEPSSATPKLLTTG
jgi:hypothetical protein